MVFWTAGRGDEPFSEPAAGLVGRGHVLELFADSSSSRPRPSPPSSSSCCYCTTCVTSTSTSESELSKLLLSELAPTTIASMSILDIGVDRVAKGSGSAARRALTCRRVVECWVLVDVCVGRLVYSHLSHLKRKNVGLISSQQFYQQYSVFKEKSERT